MGAQCLNNLMQIVENINCLNKEKIFEFRNITKLTPDLLDQPFSINEVKYPNFAYWVFSNYNKRIFRYNKFLTIEQENILIEILEFIIINTKLLGNNVQLVNDDFELANLEFKDENNNHYNNILELGLKRLINCQNDLGKEILSHLILKYIIKNISDLNKLLFHESNDKVARMKLSYWLIDRPDLLYMLPEFEKMGLDLNCPYNKYNNVVSYFIDKTINNRFVEYKDLKRSIKQVLDLKGLNFSRESYFESIFYLAQSRLSLKSKIELSKIIYEKNIKFVNSYQVIELIIYLRAKNVEFNTDLNSKIEYIMKNNEQLLEQDLPLYNNMYWFFFDCFREKHNNKNAISIDVLELVLNSYKEKLQWGVFDSEYKKACNFLTFCSENQPNFVNKLLEKRLFSNFNGLNLAK